jgi:hypothetical protein
MKQRYRAFLAFFRKYPLYGLYLLLLLLALGKQIILPSELVDTGEYKSSATNLMAGKGWSACSTADACEQLSLPETRRTPGYPMLIAIFHVSNLLLLFQFMLSAWVPFLMHKLLVKIGKETCFKIALVLILLYPLQYYYTAMIMPDILCQILILIGILAFIERKWLRVSMTVTALLLLKPVFMPWAWIALIGLFWIKGKQKIWLILPVVVVLSISWVNQKHTGVFHFSSISVTNAFEYNIRSLTKGEFSGEEMYYRVAAVRMDSMDFKEKFHFMQNETQKAIRMSPVKYAYLHAMGFAKALLDPGRYDFIAFFQLPQGNGFMSMGSKEIRISQPPSYWVYIIFFALLALLKMVMSFFAVVRDLPHKTILVSTVLYMLLIVGPVGSARYLLPVMPVMIVIAAIGWAGFFNKKQHESTIAER